MPAPVTLKSLAAATGFSVTTVSRALAGYSDVSPSTRRLILEEAERRGYEPNLLGRLLQGQRSQTIAIVMPTSGPQFPDPFFAQFVAGVGVEAAQAGFDLLLSPQDSSSELEAYRRLMTARRADGLLLIRTRADDFRIRYLTETGVPFVSFGRTDSVAHTAWIDVDGVAGQKALTSHLLELGHRRIAYITPPGGLMFTRFRLQGFREALAESGVAADPALIIEAGLSEQAGKDTAMLLLERPEPPTAIVAGNDLTAIGVMHAVRARGLRVGDDVAVGGYDGIPASEHLNPPLTTVYQPVFEIGQLAARSLLAIITAQPARDLPVLVRPQLLARASTLGTHSQRGGGALD
ncbi:MAG: LacI family DNA-binding transcriptional regulator [Anaerolineae bacterium]|nr:LacI family DNA-binding transcriptional regulator [Anaerolineae bacterium]